MLFNPDLYKAPTVTKAITQSDPLSLEGLIAWLETQPPETEYEWMDCEGGCLIGRYYAALNLKCAIYRDVFQHHPDPLAYHKVCSSSSGPTTYGAALERARALAAS